MFEAPHADFSRVRRMRATADFGERGSRTVSAAAEQAPRAACDGCHLADSFLEKETERVRGRMITLLTSGRFQLFRSHHQQCVYSGHLILLQSLKFQARAQKRNGER